MAQVTKPATNVTKLPTAARRKVDNLRYAAQREAVRAARKAEPWPGVFMFPSVREREAENRTLAQAHRSPELLIVMTMIELLSPADQERLVGKVEAYAAALSDDPSAAAALITRKLAKANPVAVGKQPSTLENSQT